MPAGRSLPFAAMSRLAWRNLWRNHRRTMIMLLAITVGVWAMIFMTALMRGMVDQMVEDGIDTLPGLVQVHHPDFRDDPSIENSMPEPGARMLQALESPVVTGWTRRVRVPAMISSERDSRGVTLLGVDPAGEIALGFDPGVSGRRTVSKGTGRQGTGDRQENAGKAGNRPGQTGRGHEPGPGEQHRRPWFSNRRGV